MNLGGNFITCFTADHFKLGNCVLFLFMYFREQWIKSLTYLQDNITQHIKKTQGLNPKCRLTTALKPFSPLFTLSSVPPFEVLLSDCSVCDFTPRPCHLILTPLSLLRFKAWASDCQASLRQHASSAQTESSSLVHVCNACKCLHLWEREGGARRSAAAWLCAVDVGSTGTFIWTCRTKVEFLFQIDREQQYSTWNAYGEPRSSRHGTVMPPYMGFVVETSFFLF